MPKSKKNTDLIDKVKEICFKNKFDQLKDILEEVISSDSEEAKEYVAAAYSNWGTTLAEIAMGYEGEEAEALFNQSFEKYEQALKVKSDTIEALDNWGITLLDLAKIKKGKDAETYFEQALKKFMLVEDINEGTAAYNIACLYSLRNNNNEALEWLEKSLKLDEDIDREEILSDEDFNNIKETNQFKKLLNQYRPK